MTRLQLVVMNGLDLCPANLYLVVQFIVLLEYEAGTLIWTGQLGADNG